MNWIGEEFGKFKASVQGRLDALEAKFKELEAKLQVPDEPAAAADAPKSE